MLVLGSSVKTAETLKSSSKKRDKQREQVHLVRNMTSAWIKTLAWWLEDLGSVFWPPKQTTTIASEQHLGYGLTPTVLGDKASKMQTSSSKPILSWNIFNMLFFHFLLFVFFFFLIF